MSGFLPFFCLLATVYCCGLKNGSFFEGTVQGTLIWGTVLACGTNILSFASALSFWPCLVFWSVYAMGAVVFAYKFLRAAPGRKAGSQFFQSRITLVIAAILALTLAVALLYPPNTMDSMGYHMPKVMYWWQNGTLAHFFTTDIRQTSLTPFAEMVIFHSFVISLSDRLANMVQWFAFLGTITVSAYTASLLGASRTGQMLAALFLATLPMGIAQATSTQTDLTVAFWLSCVANRFIVWRSKPVLLEALLFGAAVGLAILTKGSAYAVSLPFVAAFAFYSLKSWRNLFYKALLGGLLASILFMPHVYRNYLAYKELSPGTSGNVVTRPTPVTLAVNIAANILSNDPALLGKSQIENSFNTAVSALDADTEMLFPYGDLSERVKLTTNEDYAQNPLHTVLLLLSLAGVGLGAFPAARRFRLYTLAAALSFCLLLAWQPWVTRLQVPLFALGAPLAGMCIAGIKWRAASQITVLLLVMGALPSIFWTPSRPLVPVPGALGNRSLDIWHNSREELYFTNAQDIHREYIAAAYALVRENPQSIGLAISGCSYEYPLWVILRSNLSAMPEIKHLDWRAIPLDGQPVMTAGTAMPYLFVHNVDGIPFRAFKLEHGIYRQIY